MKEDTMLSMVFQYNMKGHTKRSQDDIYEALKMSANMAKDLWIDYLDAWGLELYGTAKSSIVVQEINRDKFVTRSDETASYLIYHEYGAGPSHEPEPHDKYFPPSYIIEKWVVSKGLHWTNKNGKLMSVKQMAFLISRKQYNVGLYPKPSAAPAYKRASEFLDNRISEIIDKESAMNPLKRFLGKLFRL